MATRALLISNAKLSEQAERYAEMRQYMKQVAEMSALLDDEERNLLAVAYKNEVASRRNAVKVLSGIQKQVDGNVRKHTITATYRKKVEEELFEICTEIICILDKLIPGATIPKCMVFLMKLKGDYYRYMAEVYNSRTEKTDESVKVIKEAQDAYLEALDVAKGKLEPSNPIRLGLALNCSVFFFEIQHDINRALSQAKESYGEAMTTIDRVGNEHHSDSMLIMQLLKDNLAQWTADLEEEY